MNYLKNSAVPKNRLRDRMSSARWAAAALLGVYFLSLWPAPFLSLDNLGWEIVVVLSLAAYVIQGERFNLKAAVILWVVLAFGLLGALLSLLRAPNVDQALWNTLALFINSICLLLFLTTMATQEARKMLLILLIGNGLLWSFEIQRLVNTYGVLSYSTFGETGSGKNSIGFFLALGAVTLFYLSVFFKRVNPLSFWFLVILRLIFFVTGAWLFFSLSLIYARAALIAALLGIFAICVVFFVQTRRDRRSPAKPLFFMFGLLLLGNSLIEPVMSVSPQWAVRYERLIEGIVSGSAEKVSSSRVNLLQKGWALIGDNPFLGVGVAGSRPAYFADNASYGVGLLHNSFFTEWADKGILGLFAYIVWIIFYAKVVRSLFWSVSVIDRLWLLLFMPLFAAMMFKDFTSLNMLFLTVLGGIYYEQVVLLKKRRKGNVECPT